MTIFWKSKALSLQYENRMLMKHIEDLYRQIIESKNPVDNQNQNFTETQQPISANNEEYYDEEYEEYENCDEFEMEDNLDVQDTYVKKTKKEEEICIEQPKVIENKKQRESEMKLLYGKSYRKIMGMETVVQMQYDVLIDKEKINYWPVLPIKL